MPEESDHPFVCVPVSVSPLKSKCENFMRMTPYNFRNRSNQRRRPLSDMSSSLWRALDPHKVSCVHSSGLTDYEDEEDEDDEDEDEGKERRNGREK